MANKAYIVANEQQEREVLDKLYVDGMTWCGGEEATQIIPSDCYFGAFPYVIFVGEWLSWNKLSTLEDEEIVYDGRKEERMSEKYVVSQEFMTELEEWKDNLKMNGKHSVYDYDIHEFSDIIEDWWSPVGIRDYEQNNRLIAILRWVNGEDVFEVETKKWVVRSKETDEEGYHLYVNLSKDPDILHLTTFYGLDRATRFDTKEEAESWANAHQELIEVYE